MFHTTQDYDYKVERVITQEEFHNSIQKIEELKMVISKYKRQEKNKRYRRNIEETQGYISNQVISTRLKTFLISKGITHISQFPHIRYSDIIESYGFGKTMEQEFRSFLYTNGIRTKPKDQEED